MDATLLLVREMVICFKEAETWKHRLQATKWILAAVDLFFMGVCGNKLSMKEWSEVVKKGLLTKPEAQLLLKYPGPEVVPILTTWVMICVSDALELPCFHERKNPEWAICRSQKIAHLHNRLDLIMAKFMASYRLISETMAQPIPFAYWHLMNLVFSLNFLLLALILAAFKHWLTIVPYSMALLTFMGLREVSNQLADPFGDDIVDFPLAKYLDYTFDHSVCLLQAFSAEDAYERVRRQTYVSAPFNERQVRRHMKSENLYSEAYNACSDSIYIWEKEQPLQECAIVYEKESLQEQLKKSLSAIPIGRATEEYTEGDFGAKPHQIADNQIRWLQEAEEELERMREAAPEAAKELEIVENRAEKMAEQMMKEEAEERRKKRALVPPPVPPGGSQRKEPKEEDPAAPKGDAGGGVGQLLNDEAPEAGQPLARPDEIRQKRASGTARTSTGFQWGLLSKKKGPGSQAGSNRSFRMEDVPFQLTTDASGRLSREKAPMPPPDPNGKDNEKLNQGALRAQSMRTHELDKKPLEAPQMSINPKRTQELREGVMNRGSSFEGGRVGVGEAPPTAEKAPPKGLKRFN